MTKDEVCAIFRTAVKDVRPLTADKKVYLSRKKPLKKREMKIEEPMVETVSRSEHLFFTHRTLTQKTISKLKKGGFPLEDSIDLHGLTAKEAERYLDQFMTECAAMRYRCVRIIHGKGQTTSPVLKNKINARLRSYSQVEAFCSAPTADGGTGAVYVLLCA